MSTKKIIRIRVSLKGRPIKSYKFTKNLITVGRDPASDICLDNPGISRNHVKIEETPGGYYAIEDLGSANGTYINDEQVQREYLMNNDVIRVGKFTLWVAYEEDKRGTPEGGAHLSPQAFQGTTVLSVAELDEMMAKAHDEEAAVAPELTIVDSETPEPEPAVGTSRGQLVSAIFISLLAGAVIGSGVTWFLMK